ncbi:hypothetical protein G9A89_018077 [Geosiphon pyriformis]|nr:hypothetical protein G9A89_018077 [Geosiphon pyriformis]
MVIIINQPPIELIAEPLQQPISSQQQPQQLQQPPQQQQQVIAPIAYTLIAKLEKFTGKENNAQVWLNNVAKTIIANNWDNARALQAIPYFLQDTANLWYQSLINKSITFNVFKIEFLRYFNNNNSINCLANTFTNIKQEKTEAVTTYLEHFHRNLCQIQAINANYFTVPQILNQFICELCNSIFQCNLGTGYAQNLNFQQYLSLLITPEDVSFSNQKPNQKQPFISNILPATITEDKSLTTIFFFELKEPVIILLFSKATLKSKSIMTMYTDAKVDGQSIKLILDSGLASSIITQQFMDQLGHRIDHTTSA